METKIKTVSKGKLKAKMLEYFREVEATGEPLVVTDRGREVLEIRPIAVKKKMTTAEVLAKYRAGGPPVKISSEKDLMEPVDVDEWEVLKADDANPW